MIVVADTSPLNYLILIGQVELLRRFYGTVHIPPAVWSELNDLDAPSPVRNWMVSAPEWLVRSGVAFATDELSEELDRGELEAIALAEALHADRLLVDESNARKVATRRGIPVIGTLGILLNAATNGLVDLSDAVSKLQTTNFHVSPELIQFVLDEDAKRRTKG